MRNQGERVCETKRRNEEGKTNETQRRWYQDHSKSLWSGLDSLFCVCFLAQYWESIFHRGEHNSQQPRNKRREDKSFAPLWSIFGPEDAAFHIDTGEHRRDGRSRKRCQKFITSTFYSFRFWFFFSLLFCFITRTELRTWWRIMVNSTRASREQQSRMNSLPCLCNNRAEVSKCEKIRFQSIIAHDCSSRSALIRFSFLISNKYGFSPSEKSTLWVRQIPHSEEDAEDEKRLKCVARRDALGFHATDCARKSR